MATDPFDFGSLDPLNNLDPTMFEEFDTTMLDEFLADPSESPGSPGSPGSLGPIDPGIFDRRLALEETGEKMDPRTPLHLRPQVSNLFQPIPVDFVPILTPSTLAPFFGSLDMRTETLMISGDKCNFLHLAIFHIKATCDPLRHTRILAEDLLLDFTDKRDPLKSKGIDHLKTLVQFAKDKPITLVFVLLGVRVSHEVWHALTLVIDFPKEQYMVFDPHGQDGIHVKQTEAYVEKHIIKPLETATELFLFPSDMACPLGLVQSQSLKGVTQGFQGSLPICQSWGLYEIAMRVANQEADLGLVHHAMTRERLIRFLYYLYGTVEIQRDTCVLVARMGPLEGGPLQHSLPLLDRQTLEKWVSRHGFGQERFK